MPYYTRVFCAGKEVPSLQTVLDDLREREIDLSVDPSEVSQLTSPEWNQVELIYKTGKGPIVAECNRDDGSEDSLVREEVEEFAEMIGEPDSQAKRRVIDHLKETRFVIACQLLSDIDDDGYDANGEFMSYFVRNCNGMIQADGEGFYDGTEVIVEEVD